MKILTWLLGRLDGWKRIIGWAIAKAVALATAYCDAAEWCSNLPAAELTTILEWLAEILLAWGVVDGIRKNLKK